MSNCDFVVLHLLVSLMFPRGRLVVSLLTNRLPGRYAQVASRKLLGSLLRPRSYPWEQPKDLLRVIDWHSSGRGQRLIGLRYGQLGLRPYPLG